MSMKNTANSKISWSEMDSRARKRMAGYFDNVKSGSYFEYADCQNAAFSNTIFPVYPDQPKPTLTEFMSKVTAFSREADKKSLELADYQIEYQKLWSAFVSKEQQQINQFNAQNAAEWQQWSRQTQKYLIELEKAQAQQWKTTTNTNCTVFGNSMNCTSR